MTGLKIAETIAGAKPVHDGEVLLVLDEAFKSAPTFETVAAHLHVTPEYLLASQLAIHPDRPTQATRLELLHAVANVLDPLYWENTPSATPLTLANLVVRMLTHRYQLELSLPPLPPHIQPYVFPHWPIPLLDLFGQRTCLVCPISDALESFVKAQPDHIDASHGWLVDAGTKFEKLRIACQAVRKEARAATRYALRVSQGLENVIPHVNDLVALLTDLVAFEEVSNHPTSKRKPENFADTHNLLVDVTLMGALLTRYWTQESEAAVARDRRLRKMSKLLEALPADVITELLGRGDGAPSAVWSEYLGTMVDCASAIACAPTEFARPLLEKHFAHVFSFLAEEGKISFDPSEIKDEATRALAQKAATLDLTSFASLDKSSDPVFPALPVSKTDFAALVSTSLKPISYLETVAGVTDKLAPILSMYLAEAADRESAAPFLLRVSIALTGLGGDPEPQRALLESMSKVGLLKYDDFREAVRKLHQEHFEKALGVPAEALERRLYSGAIWPWVQGIVELSGALHLFNRSRDRPELLESDYVKGLMALKATADVGVKTLLIRYETALQKLGPDKLAWGLSGDQALRWLKFIGKEGSFLVGLALSVWQTRAAVAEKKGWGDKSWRQDAQNAIFGVAMTALGMASPVLGLLAGFVVGVTSWTVGMIGDTPGVMDYYEDKRKKIVDSVKRIKAVADVKVDDDNRNFIVGKAHDESAALHIRLRGLAISLNEGRSGRPHWHLLKNHRHHEKREILVAQGFTDDEIEIFFRGLH